MSTPVEVVQDPSVSIKQQILTVHGVDSSGDWHQNAEWAFSPHFNCVQFRYREYRFLGGLKIAMLPIAIVGCLIIAMALVWYGAWWPWYASVVVPLILVLVIDLLTGPKAVLRKLVSSHDHLPQSAGHPHVMAHSFGTYLTGSLLKNRQHVKLDRIILVASVLERSFDWHTIRRQRSNAFQSLRNEIAGDDSVVRFADLVGKAHGILFRIPVVRKLLSASPLVGPSGNGGFTGLADFVHTIANPNQPCPDCGEADDAPVHNVIYPGQGHSDLLTIGHMKTFLLPYLWGFEPTGFSRFVDLCRECRNLEQKQALGLKQKETDLKTGVWDWTQEIGKGTNFGNHVRHSFKEALKSQEIHRRGKPLDRLVDRAIRLIWHGIADAADECDKSPDTRTEHIALRLYPQFAIHAAIGIILNELVSEI